MIINWYPGHMKKTHELITEHIKLVDCVVELLDSRMPYSSRNPVFNGLVGDKPRVVALNKSDLSDPKVLEQWVRYYKELGITAIPIDALHNKGVTALLSAVKDASSVMYEKLERQNRKERAIRMMIIGIPNVGKSSLINTFTGTKSAKVGNKPGVTRGKQWIRVRDDIELFDTPGILWPKIDDPYVGLNLAYTGSIRDEILPIDEIALLFLRDMLPRYGAEIAARYGVEIENLTPLEVMELIAIKRGCVISKKEIDYNRVSRLVLDEFRKGTIGQICLETPESMRLHVEEQAQEKAEKRARDAKEGVEARRDYKAKRLKKDPDEKPKKFTKSKAKPKPKKAPKSVVLEGDPSTAVPKAASSATQTVKAKSATSATQTAAPKGPTKGAQKAVTVLGPRSARKSAPKPASSTESKQGPKSKTQGSDKPKTYGKPKTEKPQYGSQGKSSQTRAKSASSKSNTTKKR